MVASTGAACAAQPMLVCFIKHANFYSLQLSSSCEACISLFSYTSWILCLQSRCICCYASYLIHSTTCPLIAYIFRGSELIYLYHNLILFCFQQWCHGSTQSIRISATGVCRVSEYQPREDEDSCSILLVTGSLFCDIIIQTYKLDELQTSEMWYGCIYDGSRTIILQMATYGCIYKLVYVWNVCFLHTPS